MGSTKCSFTGFKQNCRKIQFEIPGVMQVCLCATMGCDLIATILFISYIALNSEIEIKLSQASRAYQEL